MRDSIVYVIVYNQVYDIGECMKNLHEQEDRATFISRTIRSRILSWQYAPGARLLEQDLSEELQASRSVIREALRMLEGRGYLVKQPNRGYQVRQLDMQVAHELYELREAIECFVVARLARRQGVSDEHVRSGVAEWRHMWSTDNLPDSAGRQDFASCDRRFHEALARVLGNSTLLRELIDINDRIEIFRSMDFDQEHAISTARLAHTRIIDAIESGRAGEAVTAMSENIAHATENIRKGLTEALGRAYLGGVS